MQTGITSMIEMRFLESVMRRGFWVGAFSSNFLYFSFKLSRLLVHWRDKQHDSLQPSPLHSTPPQQG